MTATATATATEIPAEWIAWAAEVNARTEAKRAEIAASAYRRTVSLRRGADEVILSIAPADSGTSWEVQGVGYTHRGLGRTDVGDVRSRYFGDLDEAKAYANGWAASLTGKGYRITR